MGVPTNPGWPTGYTPSADEWAAAFSAKVDYPAPITQGGTGGETIADANANLLQRSLISGLSTAVSVLTSYGIHTGAGAITLNLPPMLLTDPGDWIDLYDVDFAANTNNVTVKANGADTIALYGSSANSQSLNVAGFRVRLVALETSWRMIV